MTVILLMVLTDTPPELAENGEEWFDRFEEIIKIRTMAPFLFACQYGDEVWCKLLMNIGLLKQDWYVMVYCRYITKNNIN